jgi:predicted permease
MPGWVIVAIVCVRYVILPVVGVAVVRTARELGFLSPDPLYQYVLMLQFALPPAMSIGTMAMLGRRRWVGSPKAASWRTTRTVSVRIGPL